VEVTAISITLPLYKTNNFINEKKLERKRWKEQR
jgi:hypothetical protein